MRRFLYIWFLGGVFASATAKIFAEENLPLTQTLRALFDPKGIGATFSLPSHSTNPDVREAETLFEAITAEHFKPTDLWGNREAVFGYGALADGSTLVFGWTNEKPTEARPLCDLANDYSDQRLAEVQDGKSLSQWKELRASLIGSMLAIKRGDQKFQHLTAGALSDTLQTGREALQAVTLSRKPSVLRILPVDAKEVKVLSLHEHIGTR